MRHLSPGEFVDLVEGVREERSARHLAACASCQRQLEDLRAVLHVSAAIDVPEPSPLYWDHLSARVIDAVADERSQAVERGWLQWLRAWRPYGFSGFLPIGAAAVAAVALAVALRIPLSTGRGRTGDPDGRHTPVESSAGDSTGRGVELTMDDDSLNVVVDLVLDLPWEGAADAGLTIRAGSVDHAVDDLPQEERNELQRLLREGLSRNGA